MIACLMVYLAKYITPNQSNDYAAFYCCRYYTTLDLSMIIPVLYKTDSAAYFQIVNTHM